MHPANHHASTFDRRFGLESANIVKQRRHLVGGLFTGLGLGLLVARIPLSLYTLYGVIALTGIAVNSAIVLIDAANDRLASGMGVLHAAVYAARRRVVPILITSVTTIGGLFSLAVGLGGKSLLWGPVAASIVWGLGFSTVLTLFVMPLIYWMFMRRFSGVAR